MFRNGPQPGSGWENQDHQSGGRAISQSDSRIRVHERCKGEGKNKWEVSVKRNARHERISRVASRRRKTGEIPQKRDTIRDHALSLPFSPVLSPTQMKRERIPACTVNTDGIPRVFEHLNLRLIVSQNLSSFLSKSNKLSRVPALFCFLKNTFGRSQSTSKPKNFLLRSHSALSVADLTNQT